MRASARLALATAANRSGQTAAADKQWTVMGYLRAWNLLGPFDNISQSGFQKRYVPEDEIAFDKTYTGQDDQPLRWHRLAIVSRDGQCEVVALTQVRLTGEELPQKSARDTARAQDNEGSCRHGLSFIDLEGIPCYTISKVDDKQCGSGKVRCGTSPESRRMLRRRWREAAEWAR